MERSRVANPERLIPAAVRLAVIARDGLVCQLCRCVVAPRSGAHSPTDLHLDHIIEWAVGGENTVDNLRVTCAACNLGRPKPRDVVRNAKVGFERRGRAYYWTRDDYCPPKSATSNRNRTHSIDWVADFLSMSPSEVFTAIVAGRFAATDAPGPIAVELPRIFDPMVARRQEREAARADYEREVDSWRATVRKEREAAKPKQPEPDPERVDYWRQIIAESRAARKAAKQ